MRPRLSASLMGYILPLSLDVAFMPSIIALYTKELALMLDSLKLFWKLENHLGNPLSMFQSCQTLLAICSRLDAPAHPRSN